MLDKKEKGITMKEQNNKNKSYEFKLPTYEGYTVVTRSVKPLKKIDKKFKAKLKKDGFIDFSEVLGRENKKEDKK